MAQDQTIHAGDRVVITHGEAAKLPWQGVGGRDGTGALPMLRQAGRDAQGVPGDHTSGTYRPDQSGRLPGAVSVT